MTATTYGIRDATGETQHTESEYKLMTDDSIRPSPKLLCGHCVEKLFEEAPASVWRLGLALLYHETPPEGGSAEDLQKVCNAAVAFGLGAENFRDAVEWIRARRQWPGAEPAQHH